MPKRDVTVYTCDGCKATSTVDRNKPAPGFHRITLAPGKDHWLCSICYGAVEWVTRFQRITVPPKVYRRGHEYGLRHLN